MKGFCRTSYLTFKKYRETIEGLGTFNMIIFFLVTPSITAYAFYGFLTKTQGYTKKLGLFGFFSTLVAGYFGTSFGIKMLKKSTNDYIM